MILPIYANEEHKQAVETYLTMCDDFVQDASFRRYFRVS